MAADLIHTRAFPMRHHPQDLRKGGNSSWPANMLPRSRVDQSIKFSTSKPDAFFGYLYDENSTWSFEERAILGHRAAATYIEPTNRVILPFLTFEIKSETTDGSMYAAENQMVSNSGVQSVIGHRWLIQQACPKGRLRDHGCVAFGVATTPLHAAFYAL